MIRVALIGLSVKGAMGQYIGCLSSSLGQLAHVDLFVPGHFPKDYLAEGSISTHFFRTGQSRGVAGLRLLNPLLAKELALKIRQIGSDVVHLVSGEGYPLALFLVWQLPKSVPLVVTVHDPEPHPGEILGIANAILRKPVLRRATLIHVHSARFVRMLGLQGVPARKVKVVPHGSFAHLFMKYFKPGITRQPIVLFFGRLSGYKGLDTLVRAMRLVRSPLRLVVAGPGRLPHRVRQMMQGLRYPPEIFEEYLPDARVAELFQRASVCVMPYRQATQSAIPFIAAAFGVPVVATSVGALTDDVRLTGGVLVPPGDARALAQAIEDALTVIPSYPEERSFSHLARQFAELYMDAIDRTSRSKPDNDIG